MSGEIQRLNGLEALASDLAFEWNTPIDQVRRRLEERDVRDLTVEGFRLVRFEETFHASPPIDLQYELHFSPDYEYGLRDADVSIEVVGATINARGSYRLLVDAYRRLLDHLRGRYGEPEMARGVSPEELDRLAHLMDHTRSPGSATASWMGPKSTILHELVVTHSVKQRMRFSPVGEDVVVANRTGRGDLDVTIRFPGGRAADTLQAGQERTVEVPPESEVEITVRLGDRQIQTRIAVAREARRIEVRRRWLSGRLYIEER